MPIIHPEILNQKQIKLFPKLSFLKKKNFYLAGGTALALQLGHRTSLDFDFYSKTHFDSSQIIKEIEKVFGNEAKLTVVEKETIFCQIYGADLSLFWYKYSLLKNPSEEKGILLASMEDIVAMKLIAIIQRPAKRDYIDLFFLLNRFSLKEMFVLAKKKYPNFNEYLCLRVLSFFEDLGEEDKRKITVLDKDFSWEKAKTKIFQEVKKYQLSMIKAL